MFGRKKIDVDKTVELAKDIDKNKGKTETVEPDFDYKDAYENLKKEVEEKKPIEKVEVKEPEPILTQVEQDIKWFQDNYGNIFMAEAKPVNNETIIINLLYGILMEIRKLGEDITKLE